MLTFFTIDELVAKLREDSRFIYSDDVRLSVIGEERDNAILLKLNENRDLTRSHIVLYERAERSAQVLYSFENEVDIHRASINQSRSLLAFVLKSTDASSIRDDNFQFEAWIYPMGSNRFPTCLNIKSYDEIFVNFRYLKTTLPPAKLSTPSELLTFTATKSIYLYHVESKSPHDLEIIQKQCVVKQFISAQWDAVQQCLYYSHLRAPSKLASYEPEECSRLVLTCLQFHDTIHYETVLSIPLEPASNDGEKKKNVAIENYKFGFAVLSLPSGVVCICQQHFHCREDDKTREELTDAYYSVMLLHHGCVLHCSFPDVTGLDDSNRRIIFTFCTANYILAILPGIFVHLLDIGLKHQPCNHVLIQDSGIITPDVQVLRYYSSGDSPIIFLPRNYELIEIFISAESLLSQLKSTQNLHSRAAVIHQLLVHFKISDETLEKLVDILVRESSCLERSVLFQEFLIGYAHLLCENSIPPECLKAIPLTLSKPKENQIEQGPKQLVQLTYSSLPHTSMTLLSQSQRLRPAECDVWACLWRHLLECQCQQPEEYKPQTLRDRIMVSMDYIVASGDQLQFDDEEPLSDLFQNLALSAPRNKSVDDSFLPFPEREDSTYSQVEQVLVANIREMTMHISKYFRDRSSSTLHQMALNYVSNQLTSSRLLCHHLLLSCDRSIFRSASMLPEADEFGFLNDISNHLAKSTFNLMRQYNTAVTEIAYPLPKGFSTFLSLLGFKSLDSRMYVQYINRGALQLHSDVVNFIMTNLDDSNDNADFKLDILQRLPKNKVWKFLELWDHEYSREILSRQDPVDVLETASSNSSFDSGSTSDCNSRTAASRNFSTSPPVVF